jgi:multiple sugar transport system ATP-binding protein
VLDLARAIPGRRRRGASGAARGAARIYQRRAQFLADFVEAENSMGFHADQEAARILGLSINYARCWADMSVRGNLEYGLRMRRVAHSERARLVAEAAEILGLAALLDRKPKELSGGQRQRVAVGRAIVRKPQVFLFDEPLSNLDAKFRMQMRAEIARLQKRLATTALYVTHDQVEAMTMGQRIAVMKDGRLQQVGTPLEVYGRPANLFVAGFVGSPPMNLLPVRLGGGGTLLSGAGFELPVPRSARAALGGQDGRELVAGIRPEGLTEAASGSSGGARLRAEVELAEPLGSEVVVHARHGGLILIAKLGPQRVPELGARIELELDPEALHLFDAASQARLEQGQALE